MEFENEGKYYAVWHIKEDLGKEKAKLIDEMYAGSLDGCFCMNNNGLYPDEII